MLYDGVADGLYVSAAAGSDGCDALAVTTELAETAALALAMAQWREGLAPGQTRLCRTGRVRPFGYPLPEQLSDFEHGTRLRCGLCVWICVGLWMQTCLPFLCPSAIVLFWLVATRVSVRLLRLRGGCHRRRGGLP